MNKILIIIALLLSSISIVLGQDCDDYYSYSQKARHLQKKNKHIQAGMKYSEAFQLCGNKGMWYDRYNAACSWALAGKPDSAFVQLYIIAMDGSLADTKILSTDKDFVSLHSDKRWDEILEQVKVNQLKEEEKLDKELVAILKTVHDEDQKYRIQLDEVEKKYGEGSPEVKAHWELISEKDSINLVKVKKILDERGWLGVDVIGKEGNTTLFLVIQHSDLGTQKKYLPMMREAAKKGDAFPGNLALLEDRIALGEGKKQLYGSQIGRNETTGKFYVLPLEDPENVDKRREEVGLGPLKDYAAIWGIVWNAKKYIKQLPEIEALQGK